MREKQNDEESRRAVRQHFVKVAEQAANGGLGVATSAKLGYSDEELAAAPNGADLGIGCGNPQAIAALRPGETVLDLGSGGGFDCFLAARKIGPSGLAIGVDMTYEMVSLARSNAAKVEAANVDFRLGEIERLPVADGMIDVILSNCVINLSTDKAAVFREAYRVLKPGGRLAISDVMAIAEIPAGLASGVLAVCTAGAVSVDTIRDLLRDAGFGQIHVQIKEESRSAIAEWMPGSGLEKYLASALIRASKGNGSHPA